MSYRSQSLPMAIDVPETIPVREDRRRLLALGSAWIVLGTLSGAASLTANYTTLAVFGTLSLICAVVTIRGALRSNHDATVFALLLPSSLQSVAAVLMVVYCVTATAGSVLMLAALFLGEGLIRVGVARDEHFPGRAWLFLHGLFALFLGAVVVSQLPQPNLWILGLSIGIDMACAGWSCVILARALQTLCNPATRKGGKMNPAKRRLLAGGALAALALVALLTVGNRPAARAAEGDEVEYTFGRPVKDGEHTYDWYRKTHADWAAKRYGVDPKAVGDGMDTWHWWCGADNTGFWREMAKLSSKKENVLNVRIDLLRMLHTLPRSERWEKIGLINDPDCVAAEKPDTYGLKIDRMKDGALTWDPDVFGFSSGVVGLQLFKNKNFDAKKWSIDKYLKDASSVEPPFHVGMACTVCHTAFNPNRPPKNPAEPKWENLDSHIGSQYFREGMLFGYDMPKDSFAWHYLHSQPPGTSDTTRFPTDFINGPILINSIYRLNDRLKLARAERISPEQKVMMQSINKHLGLLETDGIGGTDAEPTYRSPRVLSTGADSMGLVIAATRVYVNEGSGYKDWFSTWAVNPYDLKGSIERGFKQSEYDVLGKIRKDPKSPWMQTEARMPNMALYLSTHEGFPLKDAVEAEGKGGKNGKDYLTADTDVLRKGKVAFADHCASCHSSKKPDKLPEDAEARKKAWRDLVLRDDFLTDNFLSDDERYPCSELGTNIGRSLSPNWDAGGGYGQMSSLGFKLNQEGTEQVFDHDKDGKSIPLYNPLTGKHDIKFTAKKLLYRTPTLVSIWATAPYLHNNSVGTYSSDPSLAARMAAYKDGMTKLLWPERRLGVGSMLVTTQDSKLPGIFPMLMKVMPEFADLPGLDLDLINVPKGTPVNLLMNLHAKDVKAVLQAYVDGVLQDQPKEKFAELRKKNHVQGQKRLMEKLVEVNMCPDFIEDRGHTYGRELSDEDKRALIEYMKYF